MGASTAFSSIAIGHGSQATGMNAIAIGNPGLSVSDYCKASGIYSTAIGPNARATSSSAIAMGYSSNASNQQSIAIGYNALASGNRSVAIGGSTSHDVIGHTINVGTYSTGNGATALGTTARATGNYSTAIGYGTLATKDNQIVLGRHSDTVYIPGNLVVGKITFLGADVSSSSLEERMSALYLNFRWNNVNHMTRIFEVNGDDNNYIFHDNKDNWKNSYYSDKRMKDIIGENLDAMDKINRIKVYDFTFKKDDLKTPHVGVIAQDLQKIFPNAVTKDENGYLQIRHEDMFFAMINALKELDAKIKQIAQQLAENIKTVTSDNAKIRELTIRVNNQDKEIKALKKEIADLRKIVSKLPK